jgi:hypothetical protein
MACRFVRRALLQQKRRQKDSTTTLSATRFGMSALMEHDSRKQVSPVDDECVGLMHMPPEVLLLIGEAISRPRDLLSAQIASSLFAGTSLRGLAAWWGAKRLDRLLKVGAPPGVVRAAIAYERQTLSLDLIELAVRRCDVRVVRLVCGALKVPSPHFCFCRLLS